MIYDQTYQILADGNYGLAVSEGSFGGAHTSYYDLFRVENDKISSPYHFYFVLYCFIGFSWLTLLECIWGMLR